MFVERGSGTYSLQQFGITLNGPEQGVTRQGTLVNDRLTIIMSGTPVVYRR